MTDKISPAESKLKLSKAILTAIVEFEKNHPDFLIEEIKLTHKEVEGGRTSVVGADPRVTLQEL